MTDYCEYCAAARDKLDSGLYWAWCLGCTARHLLRSPDIAGYAASMAAGKFRADYKQRLQEIAGAKWEELHRQVRAWDAIMGAQK